MRAREKACTKPLLRKVEDHQLGGLKSYHPDSELGGQVTGPFLIPTSPHSPVALPGVAYVRVMNAMFISLFIQEVEHVFDSQWQGRATVGCAEDGLKEVIHKLLQRALGRGIYSH